MKKTFQLLNCVAVLFIVITSCHKAHENTNAYVDPPPVPAIDTLQGKEFIFSNLTWQYWVEEFGELYIDLGNRSELFKNDRFVEVSVKSVTDSTWVTAHSYHVNFSLANVRYFFSIERGHLFVLPFPYIYRLSGNTQLPGSKANVKVKFL